MFYNFYKLKNEVEILIYQNFKFIEYILNI